LDRCPCCGTSMEVVSETQTKFTLRCPNCLTTDLRIK
jgi:hypothetical protein